MSYQISSFPPSGLAPLPADYYADEADGKRPIEGYLFSYDGIEYCYTPHETTVTMAGRTFTPSAILRQSLKQQSDWNGEDLEIRLAQDAEIAVVYRTAAYGIPIFLRVYRGFESGRSVDPFVIWEGEVSEMRTEKRIVTIVVQNVRQALSRTIPRYTCQSICNHQLYSAYCGLTRADWETAATISSFSAFSPREIIAPEINANFVSSGDGRWFEGGVVSWTNPVNGATHRRMIEQEFGFAGKVIIVVPFPTGIGVGSAIIVSAGCDREFKTCRDKFNNTTNFGGFPFMKRRDPSKGVL